MLINFFEVSQALKTNITIDLLTSVTNRLFTSEIKVMVSAQMSLLQRQSFTKDYTN